MATYAFPSGSTSETITLTFTESDGHQATATLIVTVNQAPAREPAPEPEPEPATPSVSGGVPVTTARATITIPETVVVTGPSPRLISVLIESGRPRAFTATLETVKRRRELASASLRLESAGRGVIHVELPTKVKPGTYVIAVRVMTLKGKHVGKAVRRTVTLK